LGFDIDPLPFFLFAVRYAGLGLGLGAMHARAGPKGRDRPRSGPGGLGFVRRSGPREEVGFGWAVGEAKAVWAEGAGGLLVRKLDQIRFQANLEYGRLRIKCRKVEIGRTKAKPNSIPFRI